MKSYVYVGWFIKNPFDTAMRPTSFKGLIQAADRSEAFDKALVALAEDCDMRNLMNWYVQELS